MNIELRDFQEEAARCLMEQVDSARLEVARGGSAQAITLSAPTGSGKTVIVTALMERIYDGYDGNPGDPEAVFLWVSDSPELNAQSLGKVRTQSSVFRECDLVVVDTSLDREALERGKVYFLNTQKLGKDKLLTVLGEGRQFTLWQTIENTARAKPGSLYVIVDEAHRGMQETPQERQRAVSIVQKFVKGDPALGLSPVKLLVGLSATPQRFHDLLLGTGRILRQHEVPVAEVRASGLLKDRICLFCKAAPDALSGDWSLLAEAARRWSRYRDEWRRYSLSQGVACPDPILVVQVEDAPRDVRAATRTDLTKAVEVLAREMGDFPEGELAHCFELDASIEAGGHLVRKIDPSAIEADPQVRVVFFKMALTTGWDCPRAEAMMSFRRAVDHTLIAQLVGRMVRAPLARRVEGSDFLNTVGLYLPYYDEDGVHAVVSALNDPETGVPVAVDVGPSLSLQRDPALADCFATLAELPSYRVERIARTSNVRRLLKLARLLAHDEIALGALTAAKQRAVDVLWRQVERLRADSAFSEALRGSREVLVRQVDVSSGDWQELPGGKEVRLPATEETVEDLFRRCGRMLGEGLEWDYWRAKSDRADPLAAKAELFQALQDRETWLHLEASCLTRIGALMVEHRNAIRALSSSRRERYNEVHAQAKDPEPVTLEYPAGITVPPAAPKWQHHLYVDEDGAFGWHANSWEAAVLQAEMSTSSFAGWLRNPDRKPWSLCVPYRYGNVDRPLYPDLLVFRRLGAGVVVDLLDPHNPELEDAVEKARGLARYAQRHWEAFGRIELIRKDDDGTLRRLDLTNEETRAKVNAVISVPHLKGLFDAA